MPTIHASIIIAVSILLSPFYGVSSLGPPPSLPPAPSTDCVANLLKISDCLTYVEADSNLTMPDKGCCSELAGLVASSPICLCRFLGNADSFGVEIDVNRALLLPSICGVTTPSVRLCSDLGIPVGAPAGSPSGADESMLPGVQPPGESSATNSTANNENGASSNVDAALTFFVSIAFALLSTILST